MARKVTTKQQRLVAGAAMEVISEALRQADDQEVEDFVRKDMLPAAVQAMRDGLEYRNKRGLPARAFVRMFFELAELIGQKREVAQLVVNLIGVPVEEARSAVSAHSAVRDLDEHELSRRAIRALKTYRMAHPAKFEDLCHEEGLILAPMKA